MKKKKTLGWYGKDKRKTATKADNYTKEYYEEYAADFEDEAAEETEAFDDEGYIVEYENNSSKTSSNMSEEYEEEEYEESNELIDDEVENYENEAYATEEYEAYESEDYEGEEYEEAYESEDYESEAYEVEESEDEEYGMEEYEGEEYEAEQYETQEYESEAYGTEDYEVEYDEYGADEGIEEQGDYRYADIDKSENYYEDLQDDAEEYYESEEYADEYYEEDSYYDTDYEDEAYNEEYDTDEEDDVEILSSGPRKTMQNFAGKMKDWFSNMTAFDVVLASTGVVIVVAVAVIFSMFIQNKHVNAQIEAIAPLGDELSNIGIIGGEGLLAMADAALSGNIYDEDNSTEEESSTLEVIDTAQEGKVNVNFVSVEKDLKIRFIDVNTGELITGTAFEVTLTNAKGKKLVLTDDDRDGVIYAQNVDAGVFDAVVTSVGKYNFPTVPQQVTVKDKVEFVVINVQDEVKKENQINTTVEDTEKNEAAKEEVKLTDTVEWVESTKTPIGGSESYLLVDKTTIADPSQTSKLAARMLFDTLNVSLDKTEITLNVGASAELKGTSFSDSTEGDIEYKYTTEWKSSNEGVVSVSDGKVTAKSEGEAVITYTVTKKTITTTYEPAEVITTEVVSEISVEEYEKLSETEQAKCEPKKGDDDQVVGYIYTHTKETEQEKEKKTSETTETASAECKIKVEAAKITSGSLELSKSADSCAVGATLTVKPSKIVYTKQDGSTQTLTENFPSMTWESSDKSIATVDANGQVTGVKAGKVNITGKVTGVKGADDKELAISSSVEITITAAAELALSLDRTKDVFIGVGSTTTLVATVSNYKSDSGVTWETSDNKIATVDDKGVVTGVAVGSVTITAITKEKDAAGNQIKATCVVTVNSNASNDTTTKLKDKNGNQIYIKVSDGNYREAVHADYFNNSDFYIKTNALYAYTGWQTIDGKTYYYDKNGNVVTGTQIIQGVTYNFGTDGAIASNVNGTTFGIDVSRHNGNIDWNAVKASGVDFVIIRCGYRGSSSGVLIEDQNFRTNIKGATAAGLKVGVYVFSQAVNEVEAVKEASLAVSLVKGYNLTYPIFIDTESSGGRADKIDKATRTAVINAFCQTVTSAGYKAGIYASKSWYEDKLNMGAIGNYKIWLAQYQPKPTYSGRYDMWQYSSKGKISGINGNVDLNYSYLGY